MSHSAGLKIRFQDGRGSPFWPGFAVIWDASFLHWAIGVASIVVPAAAIELQSVGRGTGELWNDHWWIVHQEPILNGVSQIDGAFEGMPTRLSQAISA